MSAGHEPYGCAECGIAARLHGRRWNRSAGWHPWIRPSDEQIKARMRKRRADREADEMSRFVQPLTQRMFQAIQEVGADDHAG